MASSAELINHVLDADAFHLPLGIVAPVPQPFEALGLSFHMTKFMWLELVVAVLMIALFVPLGMRLRSGKPLRGRFGNMLEILLLFIRDQVARPSIGKHDADRYLPFLWNLFFFILLLNLFGMLPWTGSATASLGVTGGLAGVAFARVVGAGMSKLGIWGFLKNQVPHMEVPLVLGLFMVPMVFVLELGGLCVKHAILAMRLFANMFAGHLVLAVIIGFIAESASSWAWYGVAPASVFGSTALSLLELGVAFLQAYLFTFLTALFLGMAIHHH